MPHTADSSTQIYLLNFIILTGRCLNPGRIVVMLSELLKPMGGRINPGFVSGRKSKAPKQINTRLGRAR